MEWLTKERCCIGSQTHWTIESDGQEIEWDAESTEWIDNEKWVWRSISGMKNNGYWSLEPTARARKIIDKLKVEKDFIRTVDESLEEGKKYLKQNIGFSLL